MPAHCGNDETAQMEVMSEDGTTVICPNPKNYPENVSGASGTVTNGTIAACGGSTGIFFQLAQYITVIIELR